MQALALAVLKNIFSVILISWASHTVLLFVYLCYDMLQMDFWDYSSVRMVSVHWDLCFLSFLFDIDGINKHYGYVLQENVAEEVQKRIQASFLKMSASFPDSCKAEECFHKLNQMKDNSIFKALLQLLDEVTLTSAETTRVRFIHLLSWIMLHHL